MGFMDTVETVLDLLDLLDLLLSPLFSLFKHDSRVPLEAIPFPKADLNSTPPEDYPFGRKSEPSVWDQMGVKE